MDRTSLHIDAGRYIAFEEEGYVIGRADLDAKYRSFSAEWENAKAAARAAVGKNARERDSAAVAFASFAHEGTRQSPWTVLRAIFGALNSQQQGAVLEQLNADRKQDKG